MLRVAKFSALDMLYIHGSSKTRSKPFSKAILALVHLSIIDALPLWTKLPVISAIVQFAPDTLLASFKW